MAGIGLCAIGGALRDFGPQLPPLPGFRLFSLTATFEKNLTLPARFDKQGAAGAVFDKTRAITLSFTL